jgi:hypothetical protein
MLCGEELRGAVLYVYLRDGGGGGGGGGGVLFFFPVKQGHRGGRGCEVSDTEDPGRDRDTGGRGGCDFADEESEVETAIRS